MRVNERKKICIYGIFLIFYLWLAAQIPYTHDDWDWGLPVGMEQFLTASLNSRYVGNFFEVVMTRSPFLKTVIMGAGFFLLPYVTACAISRDSEERMSVFLLANVLILSIDSYIWRQTCGWIAGYANFCLSAIFLLVITGRCLRVFDEQLSGSGKLSGRILALSAVCLAGQLFIENVAIFVFLMTLLVNGIYWYRAKRLSGEYLAILAAAGVGLAIMFSSSIFRSLWNTGTAVDGYRQLLITSDADLLTVIRQCLYQAKALPFRIWVNNRYLCIAITVLMSVLLLQKDTGKDWLKYLCCAANGGMLMFLLQDLYMGGWLGIIAGMVFFAVITVSLIVVFGDDMWKLLKMLAVWLSPVGVILPIIFTTEMGERLFFTSNVMLILFAGELLCTCLHTKGKKNTVYALLLGIALVLLAGYGQIYHAVGAAKEERYALIETAVTAGKEEIRLPRYPYQEYLWYPEPTVEERVGYFKAFYGIPQDVTVIFE